jgi:hypothetical protein
MSIENFLGTLFTQSGGARKSKSKSKSHRSKSHKSPSVRANTLSVGTKRKGKDGKMYQAAFKGNKLVWKKCQKVIILIHDFCQDGKQALVVCTVF